MSAEQGDLQTLEPVAQPLLGMSRLHEKLPLDDQTLLRHGHGRPAIEIRRGSQVCDGANVYSGDLGQMQPCPTGTVCIAQPNLAGVCGVAPAGYVAPRRYTGAIQPTVVVRVIKPRSGPNPILPAVLRPRPFPR